MLAGPSGALEAQRLGKHRKRLMELAMVALENVEAARSANATKLTRGEATLHALWSGRCMASSNALAERFMLAHQRLLSARRKATTLRNATGHVVKIARANRNASATARRGTVPKRRANPTVHS